MDKEIIVDKDGLEKLIEAKIKEQKVAAVEGQVEKLEGIIHELDTQDKIPDALEGTVALIVYMFMKSVLKDKDDTVGNWKKITFAALCSTMGFVIRELIGALSESGIDIMSLIGG